MQSSSSEVLTLIIFYAFRFLIKSNKLLLGLFIGNKKFSNSFFQEKTEQRMIFIQLFLGDMHLDLEYLSLCICLRIEDEDTENICCYVKEFKTF